MTANVLTTKPELPTPFPPEATVWECPKTGLVVPKDPVENLQWRSKLLTAAANDKGLQADLFAASAQSLIFWINAFCWTYRIQQEDEDGRTIQAKHHNVPWVTWEIQDEHVLNLEHAIDEGYSLMTDKTRDMGASWNHIVVLHHQWLFRPDSLFLELSRVEEDVDGADNPKCLFVKHDYINKWLPQWMRPPDVLPGEKCRTRMHIKNPLNNSRIDGVSSNKSAGTGDRRRAVLLDEFAKVDNAQKIKTSMLSVSPCLLVNSTPFGPGTTYSKWRNSGQIKVFQLPWWEHPEKGKDRYVVQDEETGKWEIRSPWYVHQEQKMSPQELAQEVNMDHIGSGSTFFEGHILAQHKRLFCRDPYFTKHIDFDKKVATSEIPDILRRKQWKKVDVKAGGTGRSNSQQGPWKFWAHLTDSKGRGPNNGRLDQNKTYIVGADISKGQGASNSVLSVYCVESKEKVAEFACANTPPYDLARIAVAACLWIGGRGGLPLLIFEANGDTGIDFGRQAARLYQYPSLYIDKAIGTTDEKRSKRFGWHSSRDKKAAMLGAYRRALAHGGFINHCAEAIDEAETYIHFDTGEIGPAELQEESSDARKTHGDRVIADGLCIWAAEDVKVPKHKIPAAPEQTVAGRMALRKKKRQQNKRKRTFDFR